MKAKPFVTVFLILQAACANIAGIGDYVDKAPDGTGGTGGAGGSAEASGSVSWSSTTGTQAASSGASSGGTGGAATGSSASGQVSSQASSGSGCVPKVTCATAQANCGKITDDCGQVQDCGAYQIMALCGFYHQPAYTCACSMNKPYAMQCKSTNTADMTSPPPYPDCMYYQAGPAEPVIWCCPENMLP